VNKHSPQFITLQRLARSDLLHRRLAAAKRALREATEDLERYRDETKALYGREQREGRWEETR